MNVVVKKVLMVIVGLWLLISVYGFGYEIGHGNLQFEKSGRAKLINRNINKPKNVDFSLFWQVWDEVDKLYIGKVSTEKKMNGAISGMLKTLGDPYTEYFPPSDNVAFKKDLNGEFEGIGAEVGTEDGVLTVIAPIEGSPAYKSGIRAKDVILKIDGKSTKNMTVGEAVVKIRGKAGTKITLNIERASWSKPRDITITRDTIKLASVRWEWKKDKIAYIRMSQFGEDTTALMLKAVKDIAKDKPKAVILDLRSNPGGLLTTAIDTVSLFIKPGVVVKREYRNGKVVADNTTLSPEMLDTKLIVLVDEGSASASEIFAGAIQDYKRGTIIGATTFGKGLVQDFEELPNGAALKVTTAKWLTPKGRYINSKGITPDITVKNTGLVDAQLERALKEAAK